MLHRIQYMQAGRDDQVQRLTVGAGAVKSKVFVRALVPHIVAGVMDISSWSSHPVTLDITGLVMTVPVRVR